MNKRGVTDLIISMIPGLKLNEMIKIMDTVKNEEELLQKSKRDIEEILNRKLLRKWDINELRNKTNRINSISEMRNIKWVSYTDTEYPPLLREIYDPPAVLFYKGCLPNPEKSILGIVGTRKPSPDASAQAYKIACGVGKAGISVISGLALGIDSMSHRGNIAGGVPGYAVLGSGIDEVYPPSNKYLAGKILDSGGAIISEYLPGTRPGKYRFPARNRIISGLSRSVLIVEAPQKSGALITASFALEQGKDLWVASSGIQQSNKMYDKKGAVKLNEDGAEIIYSEQDIFEKWNLIIEDKKFVLNTHGITDTKELVANIADFLDIEV
jgi:DNA processing protein